MARENQSPIGQKEVDSFVKEHIRSFSDFGNPLKVGRIGSETFDHSYSFEELRDFMARGLCLELQKELRGPSENIRASDISGAVEIIKKDGDPVEYLRSKGYSDKVILRIFKS